VTGFQIAMAIVQLACAVFLIATILLQSSKSSKMSGTIMGGAETFFGKNKARTMDSMLQKLTIVISAIFVVITLLLGLFNK